MQEYGLYHKEFSLIATKAMEEGCMEMQADADRDSAVEHDRVNAEEPHSSSEIKKSQEDGMNNKESPLISIEDGMNNKESPLMSTEAMEEGCVDMQINSNGDSAGEYDKVKGEELPSRNETEESQHATVPTYIAFPHLQEHVDENEAPPPVLDEFEQEGSIDVVVAEGLTAFKTKKESMDAIGKGQASHDTASDPDQQDLFAKFAVIEPDQHVANVTVPSGETLPADQADVNLADARLKNGGPESGGTSILEDKPEEQHTDDVTEISVVEKLSKESGVGHPVVQDQQIAESFVSKAGEPFTYVTTVKELDEKADPENPPEDISHELLTVPESVFTKEPTTPAMECLTDAEDGGPSHEQDVSEAVDDNRNIPMVEITGVGEAVSGEQDLSADEIQREHGQAAFEALVMEGNEQERAEQSIYYEDERCELLVSRDQELGTEMPCICEQDDKEKEFNLEPSLAIVEPDLEMEQPPASEIEISMELLAEEELNTVPCPAAEREAEEDATISLFMSEQSQESADELVPVASDEHDEDEKVVSLETGFDLQAKDIEEDAATTSAVEEEASSVMTGNVPDDQEPFNEQDFDIPDIKWSNTEFNETPLLDGTINDELWKEEHSNNEVFSAEQNRSLCQNIDKVDSLLSTEQQEDSFEAKVEDNACTEQTDEDHHMEEVQSECDSVDTISYSVSLSDVNSISSVEDQIEIVQEVHDANPSQSPAIQSTDVLESTLPLEVLDEIPPTEDNGDAKQGDSLKGLPCTDNGYGVDGSYAVFPSKQMIESGVVEKVRELEVFSDMLANGQPSDDRQRTLLSPDPEGLNDSKEASNVVNVEVEVKGVNATLAAAEVKEILCQVASSVQKTSFFEHSQGENEERKNYNVDASGVENTTGSAQTLQQENREPNKRIVGNVSAECSNNGMRLARHTKWWGCCGMLDLLLGKD